MSVVDIRDLELRFSLFRGKMGRMFARLIMRACSIDRINRVYDKSKEYKGVEFTSRLLKDLSVNYHIGNADRLQNIPKGAFITISNHPYGGLDGIILVDILARYFPGYRLMVNKMLMLVDSMKENFIPVTPKGNKKTAVSGATISGYRETLKHLHSDQPLGIFPSGAVSDFHLKNFNISDRQWQQSIIHLIRAVKVPVLPIRFFGTNSPLFYFLGLVNWKIRSLRMPSELFNKNNDILKVGIGKMISVDIQNQFHDIASFSSFLRRSVYEMPVPEVFTDPAELAMGKLH